MARTHAHDDGHDAANAEPRGGDGVALPASASPLRSLPAGVIGHELARRLSRSAGNRSVGGLLQRQAAPATQGTKWSDVEAKLSFSQYGWEAMGVMRAFNVGLELRTDGPPAGFLPDRNVCIVNVTMPDYEIAAYFVHEMYHASQYHGGKSPAATTMAEDPWVAMMETEEVEGTLKGFLHKLALERFGYLAPENDRPVGMNYFRGAYRHAYDAAISEGADPSEARKRAIANGRRMVRWLIHPPSGRPTLGPNQLDTYEQYYHREWKQQHRRAAQKGAATPQAGAPAALQRAAAAPLLQRAPPTAAPPAKAAPPETRVAVALAKSPPDFRLAFKVLNGLSLEHMLTTLAKLRKSGHFDKLRAARTQLQAAGVFAERIELAMDAVGVDGSLTVMAFELTHAHVLAKVEPEGREAVLKFVDARYPTLKKLQASAGFKALGTEEQGRFLLYVGGTNREISRPAFAQFEKELAAGTLDLSKVASLRKFFREQAGAPAVVSPAAGTFAGKRVPYTVDTATGVKDYAFRSKKTDAWKYELTIGGTDKRTVPVYMPKKPDPKAGFSPTVDDVGKGLAALPASSLKLVKKVDVEPGRNPDDEYWAKQYKRPGFRSYMTAGADGVITIYPTSSPTSQDYLEGTMIHETGHTLSGQKWGESTDKRWKPWKDAMKSDVVVSSKYAKASPSEDFAETLQAYAQVKGTPQEQELRQLMPARMKILDELLAEKKTP